jgi:hypothetical protein
MKKNVILIDYENVQKHDLRPLLEHDVLIKVFHGENQKFTSEFTRLALEFGREKFELVGIKGQGKNAADFHIAYFIGKLSKEIPESVFHIISRDTGFKVLADFLNQVQGISCKVEPSIADMPLLKTVAPAIKSSVPAAKPFIPAARVNAPAARPIVHAVKPVAARTIGDWYALVKSELTNARAHKPKKKKTLKNQIISICKRKIDEAEADAILQRLVDNRVIECRGETIIYK